MHISVKREVTHSATGRSGLIILAVMLLTAILAPLLTGYGPIQQSVGSLLSPSGAHWLGTNQVGQDIWSQLLYGARTSLLVGFGVGVLSLLMSTIFGVSAALIGGWYDRIIMRIVDALIIIPAFIVIILVAAYFKPSLALLIVTIAALTWTGGARMIRAQALSLKEHGHISAARGFGAGGLYLARRHIVPDLGPILLVEFIHSVRLAVFMEAGLAFLGIGDPALVSWGTMMRSAMQFSYLDVWLWWLLPAGIALSLTIVSLTFIGHAAESVLDPRLRGEAIA